MLPGALHRSMLIIKINSNVKKVCIPDITYSIHLRRKTSKYWKAIIIPQYLVSFICLCAGFIPLSAQTPRYFNLDLRESMNN